jgi:hypothetical protein
MELLRLYLVIFIGMIITCVPLGIIGILLLKIFYNDIPTDRWTIIMGILTFLWVPIAAIILQNILDYLYK